jgi:starvation-inducible DNA-binding protein
MPKTPIPNDLPATLAAILADTYALAVKTHGAHWNVTGPEFFQLHAAFGEQYEALFEAADELAERLRALGARAPGSIADLARRSTLPGAPDANDGASLVKTLYEDHRRLSRAASAGIAAAQAAGDEATADLLVGRVEEHDKTAWMLSSVVA